MKRGRLWGTVLTVVLLGSLLSTTVKSSETRQNGLPCISVSTSGEYVIFENTCPQDVTVFYCSHDVPQRGSFCGQNRSELNPYYTNWFPLRGAGAKDAIPTRSLGQYDYAACVGFLLRWDIKGAEFTSDKNGNFGCPRTRGGR